MPQVVETSFVGRHDGAVDLQVPFGQGLVGVLVLVDHEPKRPGPGAMVGADVIGPHVLHPANQLLAQPRVGAARKQNPRTTSGCFADAVPELPRFFLELLYQAVVREVEVGGLGDRRQLVPRDGGRLGLGDLIKLYERLPHAISVDDGVVELILGDLDAEEVLKKPRGQANLLRPGLHGKGVIPALGQLHDMNRLDLAQKLVHLLLAVAGRLGKHPIGEVEERALVGHGQPVTGLDQRAQGLGQPGLGLQDPLLAVAAEPYGNGPRSVDQLGRGIGTEGPHDLLPPLFYLVKRQEGVSPLLIVSLEVLRQ